MINKILTISELPSKLEQIKRQDKRLILAGGVFDILHPGHIEFFKKAKEEGDILMLLLESDEAVKKYKGVNRPIFSQKDRAKVLQELRLVDYIIELSGILSDEDYYRLTTLIKPDIIAATKGDPKRSKKQEQATLNNARFIEIDAIGNHSSSEALRKIDL